MAIVRRHISPTPHKKKKLFGRAGACRAQGLPIVVRLLALHAARVSAYVAVTDSQQSALRAPLRYRGHPCPSLERGLWLAGQPDGWTSQSAVLTVGRGRGGGAQGTRATLAGAVPLQVDFRRPGG